MSDGARYPVDDAPGRKISSPDGWRADALPLTLTAADLELVDRVLCVIPELRIVTFLAQEAQRRGVTYPVSSVHELVKYLGADAFELVGHLVNAQTVAAAIPDQWFPLSHEGELLSVIHLALRRCQAERVRNGFERALKIAAGAKTETQS